MAEPLSPADKEAASIAPIEPEAIIAELQRLQGAEPGVTFPVLHPEKENRPPQEDEYVAGSEITDIEHTRRGHVTMLIGAGAVAAVVGVSVAVIARAIINRRHKQVEPKEQPGLHTIQKSLEALEALRKRGAQVNWRRPWDRNPYS